ncbi:hypothetical protein BJX61DRAFT_211047 [Aspergillus egyptiacus]|nr:hypothetical protein BJX61DRAFT_211047 [Aspergillus egyptiacus]
MRSSITPLRAPPRYNNARPQFASTPRFLLSQRAVGTNKEIEDSDTIFSGDDTSLSLVSGSRPAQTQVAPSTSTLRRKEVIEDSDSERDQEQGPYQQVVEDTALDTSSSPLNKAEADAELEALFGPTRCLTKKRRVSPSTATPVTRKRKPHDRIESSPPEPPYSTLEFDPPSPSLPYRNTPEGTPRPPPPSTPAPGKSSTLSRRKPFFVLPRSPSPDRTDETNPIPTPFSPSSRALRRRGRVRSSAPTYLPGGMAAEVRSWVLEMGTKREQAQASLNRRREPDSSLLDNRRYSAAIRISNVRQSALGSCGPLAFIRGQAVEATGGGEPADKERNILLLGAPRPRAGELRTSAAQVPGLQVGDIVGVCRGLVWELDIDGQYDDTGTMPEHEQILRRESQRSPELGRWLVGMEWGMIQSA